MGTTVIKMAQKNGDTLAIIGVSSFIGNAFLQSDDTLTARKVFRENVDLATQLKNTRSIIMTQIDLANFYALTKNSKKAIELYLATIPFAEASTDTKSLYVLHSNIAELSLDNQDITSAQYHVDQMNNYVGKDTFYFNAGAKLLNGRLAFLLNKFDTAELFLKDGIHIAEEIKFDEILIELYDYLSKVEAARGNYQAAYNAKINHQRYLDEKYEQDKITAIETVTAKYKLNEFKHKIEEQALKNELDQQAAKRETTILWIKIASAILLVFSLFLFRSYINRKKLLKDLQIKNKQYLLAKTETEELSKAKSILFSNMTHELRTPMYGIIGITSILLDDERFKEQKENLSSLKFSADYLLSLINNVLYFNKMEAEHNDVLKEKEFDIRKLLYNIVESAKFLNPEHNNTFGIHIDETIPENVIGDYTKISQIIMNLLSNASKFTEEGKIEIEVDQKPCKNKEGILIHFSIKDTGKGMSKERQDELREDSLQSVSMLSSAGGNGLGFPIVKRILEQHNSKVNLTSEKGRGTTVSFQILFGRAHTPPKPKNKTLTHGRPLEDVRILIVDDNKINQMVTQRSVESCGAKATVAGCGDAALELVAREEFDLILMDINMPGMDGFETTEHIRKSLKDIPIIALTAVEKEKVINQEGFSLMNDIVIKPYKGEQFIEAILKNLNSVPKA